MRDPHVKKDAIKKECEERIKEAEDFKKEVEGNIEKIQEYENQLKEEMGALLLNGWIQKRIPPEENALRKKSNEEHWLKEWNFQALNELKKERFEWNLEHQEFFKKLLTDQERLLEEKKQKIETLKEKEEQLMESEGFKPLIKEHKILQIKELQKERMKEENGLNEINKQIDRVRKSMEKPSQAGWEFHLWLQERRWWMDLYNQAPECLPNGEVLKEELGSEEDINRIIDQRQEKLKAMEELEKEIQEIEWKIEMEKATMGEYFKAYLEEKKEGLKKEHEGLKREEQQKKEELAIMTRDVSIKTNRLWVMNQWNQNKNIYKKLEKLRALGVSEEVLDQVFKEGVVIDYWSFEKEKALGLQKEVVHRIRQLKEDLKKIEKAESTIAKEVINALKENEAWIQEQKKEWGSQRLINMNDFFKQDKEEAMKNSKKEWEFKGKRMGL